MPTAEPGSTLAAAFAGAVAALRAGAIEVPERDARLLIEAATGWTRLEAMVEPGRWLGPAAAARLGDLLARRIAGEPVSRILGVRDFWGRTFAVTGATLDPRPETETVVETVLALVREGRVRAHAGGLRILDVGTGSGCLIATLLAEIPDAVGVAIDPSPAALGVARANAARHGIADRIAFVAERAGAYQGPQCDILVSNPPYIPTADLAALPREVRDHDPHLALDGGADGLDVYREIIAIMPRAVPAGWAVFEIGRGQAEPLSRLLDRAGHSAADGARCLVPDLAGVHRCVAQQTRI
jgi:release factor glutamine methyltransferase